MDLRKYLEKQLRQRKRLMRMGVSKKNASAVSSAIRKVETWLSFYKNASNDQVKGFVLRNYKEVQLILPGVGSSSAAKSQEELMQLLTN